MTDLDAAIRARTLPNLEPLKARGYSPYDIKQACRRRIRDLYQCRRCALSWDLEAEQEYQAQVAIAQRNRDSLIEAFSANTVSSGVRM